MAALLACCVLAPELQAHHLGNIATSIIIDPGFVPTMTARAATNGAMIQMGDEFGIIMKATPDPAGTLTGVGGYQTFYIPAGMQVTGAAFVEPDPSNPGYFRTRAARGQSIIAIGDGSIGAKVSVKMLTNGVNGSGLILGPNVNGVTTKSVVDGTGLARGTIAGVYADTGIFFSTNSSTAFYSYQTSPAGSETVLVNNNGQSVGEYNSLINLPNATTTLLGVTTLWDSYQERAFGRKDVAAIVDPLDERGNAPWGLASAVAGPQSGYQWGFNYFTYTNTAPTSGRTAAQEAAAVQAAIEVGPWQRIQYPGSQISSDTPGLISTTLGYAGIDGSSSGIAVSSASPLPTTTTAVRFAQGLLQQNVPLYARVTVKILTAPATSCPVLYADAFGGDAGGEQGGKDHLWRYFDPTVVSLAPCVTLQKVASQQLVSPGGSFYYTITFANNGSAALPNVQLTDTLPSGVSFVSAVPAPNSTSPLQWNLGTVGTNQIRSIKVNVTATGTGEQLNKVVASSPTTGTPIAVATETVFVASKSDLHEVKTVTPSSVAPGGTVTYTLTITNNGNLANGSPLIITEYLPAGFSFGSLVSSKLNGGTTVSGVVSVSTTNPNQPTITVSQGINPASALVLTFTANVSASEPAGTYNNLVSLNYESKTVSGVPEAPVVVGTGSIGDTVYEDANGNGSQDSGELGIPGVVVSLYKDVGTSAGIYDAGDTLVTTTTTDASGHYLFSSLTTGNYVVKIGSPPTGTNTQNPASGTGAVTNPTNEGGATITGSNSVLTVDFGYQLSSVGVIGDQVFYDANNNTTFDSGTDTGLNNVTVFLYDSTGTVLLATTTTALTGGTNGFYAFSNLPPTNYVVKVDLTDTDIPANYNSSVSGGLYSSFAVAGGASVLTKDFPFNTAYLSKAVSATTGASGTVLTYTLTPFYPGSGTPLTNATLTDTLPGGETFAAFGQSGGVANTPPLTWTLGTNVSAVSGSATSSSITQRGSTATGTLTSAGTTLSITSPAGVVAGDVMLANLVVSGASSAAPSLTGWTRISSAAIDGTTFTNTVLYRVATGNEGSTAEAFNVGTGATGAGEIVAFTGVNASGGFLVGGGAGGPFDVAPGSLTTSTAPATTAISGVASITTASANAAVIMFAGAAGNSTLTAFANTSPGSLTTFGAAVANNVGSVSGAFAAKASAGATGTGSATEGTKKGWGAIQLALKPTTTNTTTTLSVDKLLVTDPSPGSATTGTNIVVTMTVGSDKALTGVTPPTITANNLFGTAGTATLISSNTAAASISAGGTTTFTWTFRLDTASSTANWKESFTFSTPSFTSGGTTFGSATSPGVIVTQPLTFTATVNASPGVSGLTNSANINNNGTLLFTTPQVVTTVYGSIGDQVFYDANNNGAYDSGTDTGLTNVVVNLYDSTGTNLVATTTTGVNGIYTFGNVTPGNYVVKVDLTDPDIPSNYSSSVANGTYASFALASGQAITDKDFPFTLSFLGKSVDKATASAGDILTYTLTPYYPGPNLLTNVIVADTNNPPGSTFVGLNQSGWITNVLPINWALGTNVAAADGSASLSVTNGNAVTIALRGTATTANAASGATTLTISKPTGVVSNDLMIANIELKGGTSTQFPTLSGWTTIATSDFEGSGQHHRIALLYRIADGSEGASFIFGFSGGTAGVAGAIVAFSGVDTSSGPFEVTPGSITAGSGTSISAVTALSTTSTNAAVIMFAATFESSTLASFSTTSPGSLTSLYGSSANANGTVGAGWAIKSTSGSTGAGTAVNGANKAWGAMLLALKNGSSTTITSTNSTVALTVDQRLVTDPSPSSGTVGTNVVVTMTVGSDQALTGVTPPAGLGISKAFGSGATATLVSGPTPSSASISAGGTTAFTYTYRLDTDSATNAWRENLTFTNATFTTAGVAFPVAASPGVILTQPLVFRVSANTNASFGTVTNSARLYTNGNSLLFTSPQVTTTLYGSIGDTTFYDDGSGGGTGSDGIQNGTEAGVNGAEVTLYQDNGIIGTFEPGIDLAITSQFTATSGPLAGQYLFTNLTAGNYLVVAEESTVVAPPSSANAGLYGYMVASAGAVRAVTLPNAASVLTADFGFVEKGLLEGTTFWDKNHDSIFEPASDTVEAGITVWLDTNNNGVLDVGEVSTTTDADGEYQFLVAPGNYTVRYLNSSTNWPAAIRSPSGDQTTVGSYSVSVAAGQEVEDLNFGRANSGQIGDTVFADLDNSGTQNTGDVGIQGVTVSLFSNADGSAAANGDEVFLRSAVTDASGKYLFVGLPDGNYLVTVNTATNSLPASFSSTTTYEQDGSHNSQNAATISGGNAVLDRDFGYPLAASLKYSVSGKVWNDQNANGSQDANYETNTFVGVTVTAQVDLNGDGVTDYTLTTTTGTQGGYTFTNIPGGSNVQIIVDTTTLPSPGYTQVDDPDATKDNQTTITGLGSNVTGQDFGYQGVIRLGNRVWLDNGSGVGGTNNDGILNGTEPGISNVVVQVYSADPVWGTPTGSALATTTTDTNGYYAFYLNAGQYVIVIPSTNFGSGGPLTNLYSSGTSTGTFNGVSPDLNHTDGDDNGFNAVNPASSGVYSAAFTLTVGGAPTGETDLGPGDSLATDNSADLTVDFGFTTASPTAVTLAYVKGWWSGGQVTVEWKTVTEMNTLGFDLYRLNISGWVQVNQDLVPALNVEKGGVYRVNDPMARPSGTIHYVLVEHETTGRQIEYGPFDVTVDPAAKVVSMQMVDRALDFKFQGDPATDYQIESTDDLIHGTWQPIGVFRSDPLGAISFHQPVDGSEPVRFYRAMRP